MAGEIISAPTERVVGSARFDRRTAAVIKELGLLGHRIFIEARDVDPVFPGLVEIRATLETLPEIRCGNCATVYRDTRGRCPECDEATQLDAAVVETRMELEAEITGLGDSLGQQDPAATPMSIKQARERVEALTKRYNDLRAQLFPGGGA